MSTAPTTHRGRVTLELILDTASVLFYRQGVRATSLNQIIAESGTGKGQLYHYFADKRELVYAVIQRQIEAVLDAQRPLIDDFCSHTELLTWAEQLIRSYEHGDDPVRPHD